MSKRNLGAPSLTEATRRTKAVRALPECFSAQDHLIAHAMHVSAASCYRAIGLTMCAAHHERLAAEHAGKVR